MAGYITRIRTTDGDRQIDYNALANLPVLTPDGIGAAQKNHTHDDKYYPKEQVDTLLSAKAESKHSHDDVYYQKEQVDILMGNKAESEHSHDDVYYPQTDIDAFLAEKASVDHNHDSSYCSGGEVDNRINEIAAPKLHEHDSNDIIFTDIVLTSDSYGTELPSFGIPGRIFFKVVG